MKYGHPEVRQFNFDAIKVPIVLFCGKTDLMASKGDYLWLNKKLAENKKLYGGMHEYKLGHMGLIMPDDRRIFKDYLNAIIKYNNEGDQTILKSGGQHTATANCCAACCTIF